MRGQGDGVSMSLSSGARHDSIFMHSFMATKPERLAWREVGGTDACAKRQSTKGQAKRGCIQV